MDLPYTLITDLAAAQEVIPESTVSRIIYQDKRMKGVLFAFAAGQELSEHTAAVPAILHFIRGEARVTLGHDTSEVSANAWVHMPANLPHSIYAHTDTIMLLLLLKSA